MKPLVYYCRWNDASLRLRGRDETAVWGQLVFSKNETKTTLPFHFDLNTWALTLGDREQKKVIRLDEMGVEH